VTGGATAVTQTGGTLHGSVNQAGTAVQVGIQFGPTTSYGRTTGQRKLGPANVAVSLSGAVGGLKPGTTVHYRAFARTDLGTFFGADRTFRTVVPPAPTIGATVPSRSLKQLLNTGKFPVGVRLNQKGSASLAVTATFRSGGHLHRISPFNPSTVAFGAPGRKVVTLHLKSAARRALASASSVTLTIRIRATNSFHRLRTKTLSVTLK
jgi:hypothetical protein